MEKTREQPSNLPELQSGDGPSPEDRQAMATASAAARRTGKAVPVDRLTTEANQVVAEPKGGFSFTATPKPVRTKQGGAWVAVDTTLRRSPDGRFAPVATAYGSVTLSGGGDGPLAVTTSGSTSYTVTWPAKLPKPSISGSTATYADVLPGVDLAVSATTAGGFSEVLVVKSVAAAKNPALADIKFATKVTGGTLHARQDGLMVKGEQGANVLDSTAALMWDSNTTLAEAQRGAQVAADSSDITHAGAAAKISEVGVHADDTTLSLRPDKGLLDASSTVYPVYIDPSFNWHPTNGGTPAFAQVKQGSPCNGTSFYNNSGESGDYGQLGVGVNHWHSCIGIMRTYYQWGIPSAIWDANIASATVDATEVYSASCTVTATVNLHWAGGIGPGTSWNNQPGYGGSIAQADFPPSYNATYCPRNGWVSRSFNVQGAIAESARAHSSQFTVALNEDWHEANNNSLGFKRFSSNPGLQIYFNHRPDVSGQLAAVSGSNNAGCATTTPYPYMGKTLSTNTPVLTAVVTDRNQDQLKAFFDYWIEGEPTVYQGQSADNLSSGTTAMYSLPPSFVSKLTNGKVVGWHVTVWDGEQDGWSGWSSTCHFITMPTAPDAPRITSADGFYPNDGRVGKPAQTPGRFTLSNPAGQNATSVVHGLDQQPPTSNPPSNAVTSFNGGAEAGPAARWPLSEGTGTTSADSTGRHPATLNGGASWTTDPVRGNVLSFNGDNSFAATRGPVLNTGSSFSISAWVKCTADKYCGIQVSQDGTQSGGFYLEYSNNDQRWAFTRATSAGADSPVVRALALRSAQFGTWTHLVGTYDVTTGAMRLYVDGVPQGRATLTTPFDTPGPLVIGRGSWNGKPQNYTISSISDVQAYSSALSASDVITVIRGQALSPTGRWRMMPPAESGNATSTPDSVGGRNALLYNGTIQDEANGGVKFTGNGYAATTGPVLDTTKSFTVSAWVNPAALNGSGVLGQDGDQQSGFYLEHVQSANRWSFSRVTDDVRDAPAIRAQASTEPKANVWTHLTGTYDATDGSLRLYVNGKLAGSATDTTPFAANGSFTIGRAKWNGNPSGHFTGTITDVQTYASALSETDIGNIASSATIKLTPVSPGPHTLWAYTTNVAGDVSGYQAYRFVSAGNVNRTCASLAACFDNTAISPDADPTKGSADGWASISEGDLRTAGWQPNGKVTINGATVTLPDFGAGRPDNVLAANQTITYSQPIAAAGTTSLEFLATSTHVNSRGTGAIAGNVTAPYVPEGTAVTGTYCFDSTNPSAVCPAVGKITYTDGSTQSYVLTVPDWIIGPPSIAAVSLPHQNRPGGQSSTEHPKLYPFSVPLRPAKPGLGIASVTLPDVGSHNDYNTQLLHIFGMATRNTTNGPSQSGSTWTGAWASPSEGNYNFQNGTPIANQTFRTAIKPSLSGGTVRIKLDNALGMNKLAIGKATIAIGTTNPDGTPSPKPAPVPPVTLSFNGSTSVELPQGGMAFSDPVSFPAEAGRYLLLSFSLTNSVPSIVEHSWANSAVQFVSPPGSGDKTADTSGLPFTTTGSVRGNWTNVVTGLDVLTNGTPTQAVLGDGLVDSWHPGTAARNNTDPRLADNIAATEATTPRRYGTVAAGIRSNHLMADNPTYGNTTVLSPSALSRIDRDILSQPGISTVVINEGLQDVLSGREGADVTSNGYTAMLRYMQANGIKVVVVGLTPCGGYAGHGATPNDPCSSAVDIQRQSVNKWLSGNPLGEFPPTLYYLDSDVAVGRADPAGGPVKLHPAADAGDHVNLTTAGYAALASTYFGPQDTWLLDDGAGTTASDTAASNQNPFLANNPLVGTNPVTLTGGTWPSDPGRGTVLELDGTASGATDGPVLTTSDSYTVSGWVNLPALPDRNATVIAQDGSHSSTFSLQQTFSAGNRAWSFGVSTADGGAVTSASGGTVTANKWTHLVGVYNATTRTAQLYVDGKLTATANNATSWNAPGPLTLGRAKTNDQPAEFFPGRLSNIQAWNYALGQPQVSALYQQI